MLTPENIRRAALLNASASGKRAAKVSALRPRAAAEIRKTLRELDQLPERACCESGADCAA